MFFYVWGAHFIGCCQPQCVPFLLADKIQFSSVQFNVTEKHIKEVSLSGLFLMEAAKKADRAFGAPPPSTRHTATDASSDIKKITEHLLKKNATTEVMFITCF